MHARASVFMAALEAVREILVRVPVSAYLIAIVLFMIGWLLPISSAFRIRSVLNGSCCT